MYTIHVSLRLSHGVKSPASRFDRVAHNDIGTQFCTQPRQPLTCKPGCSSGGGAQQQRYGTLSADVPPRTENGWNPQAGGGGRPGRGGWNKKGIEMEPFGPKMFHLGSIFVPSAESPPKKPSQPRNGSQMFNFVPPDAPLAPIPRRPMAGQKNDRHKDSGSPCLVWKQRGRPTASHTPKSSDPATHLERAAGGGGAFWGGEPANAGLQQMLGHDEYTTLASDKAAPKPSSPTCYRMGPASQK